jgi:hypothetical protein
MLPNSAVRWSGEHARLGCRAGRLARWSEADGETPSEARETRALPGPSILPGPNIRSLVLALACGLSAASAATSLTLSESSGAAGTLRDVPLWFETTDTDVVAVQLDLVADGGRALIGTPLLGPAAPAHTLDSEPVSGRLRTVVYSMDNSALVTGRLLEIPLNFLQTVPETERAVSLANVVLSRRNGGSVDARLMPFGRLVAPTDGPVYPSALSSGGGLNIRAIALDTDAEVSSVEFLVNGQSIGLATHAPFALTWTPSAEGGYVIAALVTDSDGNLRELESRSISIALLSSYTAWSSAYFGSGADPLVAGLLADPNGNGLVNLFEFALGRDPQVHRADGLPQPEPIVIEGKTYLSLTYRVPVGARGVAHRVEFSPDLVSWFSGPGHTVEEPPVIDGLIKTVRVRTALPLEAPRLRGFLRLVVSAE